MYKSKGEIQHMPHTQLLVELNAQEYIVKYLDKDDNSRVYNNERQYLLALREEFERRKANN